MGNFIGRTALGLLTLSSPMFGQKTQCPPPPQPVVVTNALLPVSISNIPTVNIGSAVPFVVDVRSLPSASGNTIPLKSVDLEWTITAGTIAWPFWLSGPPSPGKHFVLKSLNICVPTAPDGFSPGSLRVRSIDPLGPPFIFPAVQTKDGWQIVNIPDMNISLPNGLGMQIYWPVGSIPYTETTIAYIHLNYYEADN